MTTAWAPNTFLGGLPPATADEVVGLSVRRQFAPGRVVLREGDRESHVELILSGFVKVTTSVEGVETLLGIRAPGEVVGEIGALTDQPRSATVTACGRVLAGVVTRADFEAFLRRHPDAALRVTAAVAEQLRWANRRRIDFAVYPAHVRLARLLVEIAGTCGRPGRDGGVEIGVPLSQPELATMIAIGPATVQKAIQELRGRGLISTGYRRLTLLDLDALRQLGEIP
ncbi:Crp/Fnr family transcriptional regulator [Dactylosporangium sp. AC04546]|uniref:Crp/Fnr family transcriptional regulator n=1 Tax=Dactylosporangium sp. AC04546 TaxID=2862460 RepID=UPI001EDE67A7|nr:Crp/Fnr family transcriptional regulator [Dactylosporangium sp. AC04546]WVK87493.1 Crp/Fnr family transcriptional regulator [Dactylosporangium sp. AC04546]